MNNLMQYGKAVLFSLVLGFTLLVAACTKPLDPCAATNCQNGGVCNDGTCQCLSGYEGAKCATEKRLQFIGNYCALTSTVVETLSADPTDINRLKSARFGILQFTSDSTLTLVSSKTHTSASFYREKKTGNVWISYIQKFCPTLWFESFKLCK